MALREQPLGLCSTCNNSPMCLRRKGIRPPIFLCEEFDDSIDLDEKEGLRAAVVTGEEPLPGTVAGLCHDCGNRATCTLQDSPGGVWHCEEYC